MVWFHTPSTLLQSPSYNGLTNRAMCNLFPGDKPSCPFWLASGFSLFQLGSLEEVSSFLRTTVSQEGHSIPFMIPSLLPGQDSYSQGITVTYMANVTFQRLHENLSTDRKRRYERLSGKEL